MRPSPRLPIRGLSLVELLSVMAVLVIVMGFIVPAVTGMARATALVSGGNMVTNLASLARQTAVSKNTMSALVLLGNQGTPEDYRAWTVLEYAAGGGGWLPVTGWQKMPDGIVVDFADATNCTFCEAQPTPFPFLTGPPARQNPPVDYFGKQVGPTAYAVRIYLPNGGLQNPEKPAQIRVIEGYAQGGQIVRTHPGTAGLAANYYDVAIIGASGVTKVSRP